MQENKFRKELCSLVQNILSKIDEQSKELEKSYSRIQKILTLPQDD